MSTVTYQGHVAMFRELSQVENISDRDYEKLTIAEDCILAHQPRTADELLPMQDVIRARYGEDEDEALHGAVEAIVNFAGSRSSTRRAA